MVLLSVEQELTVAQIATIVRESEAMGLRVSDETVRRALQPAGMVRSRPQHQISSPDPEYALKKRRLTTLVTI
jgi:hypothetical protein